MLKSTGNEKKYGNSMLMQRVEPLHFLFWVNYVIIQIRGDNVTTFEIIKDLCYIVTVVIAIAGWYSSSKSNGIKQAENFMRLDMKLDSVTKELEQLRKLQDFSNDLDKRLNRVENTLYTRTMEIRTKSNVDTR